MKFYTHQWFSEGGEPDDIIDAAARSYFQSLQPKLTESIRAFVEAVNLHDAHLVRLDFSAEPSGLKIEFDELFWDSEHRCGDRRPLVICYGRVSAFTFLQSPPSLTYKYTPPCDDLLGDEMDIVAEGIYEHRMVFSSGGELHIRFQNFSYSNLPSRHATGNSS